MTDEQSPQQSQDQAQIDQQNFLVRQALYNSVNVKYLEFLQSIKNVPLIPQNLGNAFLFLETAMLWVKEAVFFGFYVTQPALPATNAPVDPTAVHDDLVSEQGTSCD